jgi:hypothetical protein
MMKRLGIVQKEFFLEKKGEFLNTEFWREK